MPGLTDLVAAIAAFGLPGYETPKQGPLDQSQWEQLEHRVREERIEGLLAAAVEAGVIEVSPDQHEATRQAARSRAVVDLSLERELIHAAGRLRDEGIPFRVLKGPAWAHSVYPNPSWRGFGDVDLLIPTRHWYGAIEILEAGGARRLMPELRPGFDVRFGKDATLATAGGWEIDLHRVLVVGPYGLWADDDELFGGANTVAVGGTNLPVLDPEPAFLNACYNAALSDHPPRLAALRDVAQMALSGTVDSNAASRLAQRWRGRAVVAEALHLVSSQLGVNLPPGPFDGSSRFADRALLASYRGRARGFTSQAAGVVAVPGWKPRAEYLAALLRPQPDYLAARNWSSRTMLGQGLRRWRRR